MQKNLLFFYIVLCLAVALPSVARAAAPMDTPIAIDSRQGIVAVVPKHSHSIKLFRIKDGSSITSLSNGEVEMRFGREMIAGYGPHVTSISFSPSGQRIVTSNSMGELILWDVPTGQSRVLLKERDAISVAIFSPKGNYIAVASRHQLTILDAETGKKLWTNEGQWRNVDISPDERLIAGWSSSVRVLEMATGQAVAKIPGGNGDVVFLDEYRLMVASSGDIRLESATTSGGEVQVFEARSGELLPNLGFTLDLDKMYNSLHAAVNKKDLFLGFEDGKGNFCIFDIRNVQPAKCLGTLGSRPYSFAFDSESQIWLSANNNERIDAWVSSSGDPIYSKTFTNSATIISLSLGVLYVISSFCLFRIARLRRYSNSWLALIPIANLFFLPKLAEKSSWLGFLLFLPIFNLLCLAYIGSALSRLLGRSPVLGYLLGIPIAGVFLLLYLAITPPVSPDRAGPNH